MANINTELAHLEKLKGDRMTKAQAAECLGIGKRTLERWASQGRIHAEKVGHFTLFDMEEVERLQSELQAKTSHKGRTTPYAQTMREELEVCLR